MFNFIAAREDLYNDLDERVQGKFLKGSFLGSKMDSFFGDGVGGLPSICEWSEALTVTFMEEAEQYGGVNEVVVVSQLLPQSLVVFGGDKCQTPGGLNRKAKGLILRGKSS